MTLNITLQLNNYQIQNIKIIIQQKNNFITRLAIHNIKIILLQTKISQT